MKKAQSHVVGPAALSPRQQRSILGLLLLINTVNFIDRQIITILAEPLRMDLSLSDWHIGVLTGLAFALLYTTAGIPLARWADRNSRPVLISMALTVWSLFTAASAFVVNFAQLLITRIGVGIGEAGCTPAAHSLISDITPADRRASALAIYTLGVPIGSLLGLSLGGLIGNSLGWRMTFLIAGLPGLVLAAVVWFVPEPRDRRPVKQVFRPVETRVALRELWEKRAFRWLCAGAAAAAFVYYGQTAFYGTFFLRTHNEELNALAHQFGLSGSMALLGILLGMAIGLGGALGTWLGGLITELRLVRDPGAYATVPAVATLLAVPFFIGAAFIDKATLAAACVFGAVFFQSMTYGPMFAGAQNLVRPQIRATASAILLFVVSAIGLGLGPLAIGILSDAILAQTGRDGLMWSMAFCAGAMLLSPVFFLKSRATFAGESYGEFELS